MSGYLRALLGQRGTAPLPGQPATGARVEASREIAGPPTVEKTTLADQLGAGAEPAAPPGHPSVPERPQAPQRFHLMPAQAACPRGSGSRRRAQRGARSRRSHPNRLAFRAAANRSSRGCPSSSSKGRPANRAHPPVPCRCPTPARRPRVPAVHTPGRRRRAFASPPRATGLPAQSSSLWWRPRSLRMLRRPGSRACVAILQEVEAWVRAGPGLHGEQDTARMQGLAGPVDQAGGTASARRRVLPEVERELHLSIGALQLTVEEPPSLPARGSGRGGSQARGRGQPTAVEAQPLLSAAEVRRAHGTGGYGNGDREGD